MPIAKTPFDEEQSKFFKRVYQNPPRIRHPFILNAKIKEKNYDMFMITYNEPNANENYARLKDKYPNLKRIHGVKGIPNAHKAAAEICETDMMWIIDGDAEVLDSFRFDYEVPLSEKDAVHVWRSINPINDLEYGYGGVKLLPTELTRRLDVSRVDMTTSISSKFKKMERISNITAFNTDPFNTWKSAFRECAKLASSVIKNAHADTEHRLNVWCEVGELERYGKFAIEGARAGRDYGKKYSGDTKALDKINDFEWLKEKFNECR